MQDVVSEAFGGLGGDDATAEAAAAALDDVIEALLSLGLPFDSLMAGLHAQIVLAVSARHGPEVAAGMCDRMAERIRGLPAAVAAGEVRLDG